MIHSKFSFFFSLISTGVILYTLFVIFHYYYEGNYCSPLSGLVEKSTIEEIKVMAKCEDNYFCEVGESFTDENGMKDFTCIRSIQPKVWRQ